jgi:hypothetical protein
LGHCVRDKFRPVDADAAAAVLRDCVRSMMYPQPFQPIDETGIESRAQAIMEFLGKALQ